LSRSSHSGVCRLASTSSDGDSDEEKIPATGWDQNLPDESSIFWKSSSDRTNGLGRQSKTRSNQRGSSSSSEPRTGWLHNTKSKQTAKKDSVTAGGVVSAAQRLLQQAKMKDELNHRIIAPPAFHACGDGRQVVVTEHLLSLPIYRARPASPRLDVYFSVMECARDDDQQRWHSLIPESPRERAERYVRDAAMKTANDMILYLQGGPGFGAPIPVVDLGMTNEGSWAGKALSQYKRVVLMDQRGTGRSTPITKQTLEKRFPDLFLFDSLDDTNLKSVVDFDESEETARAHAALSEATDFLAQFRADNIVQDAEAIKDALMLPVDTEVRTLSCMDQSLLLEFRCVFLTFPVALFRHPVLGERHLDSLLEAFA
jgi:hypothetical protein